MNSQLFLLCSVFCLVHATWTTQEVTFTPEEGGVAGTCTAYRGYDIRPGFDLDLIPYSSTSQCCRLCFQNPECKGWTMFERKCHLKSSNELVKARDEQGTYSGLRDVAGNGAVFSNDGPQVESPNGSTGVQTKCSVHHDQQIVGGTMVNLGYMYLSECCHRCGNTAGCEAWTYHDWQCILKNGTTLTTRKGDISGLKIINVATENVAPSATSK